MRFVQKIPTGQPWVKPGHDGLGEAQMHFGSLAHGMPDTLSTK
jgi:hypothetical protein